MKVRPTANPSMLKTWVDLWKMGYMNTEELMRRKKEALGINVYTGKEKNESDTSKRNHNEYSFQS